MSSPCTIEPSADDRRLASEMATGRWLKRHLSPQDQRSRVQIFEDGRSEEAVTLPKAALKLLDVILTEMARGNAVTVQAAEAELSPKQAADLLDVSRPFLIKLLESGAIISSKPGPDCRIPLRDLLRYKESMQRDRRAALDELVAEAQELGLGY